MMIRFKTFLKEYRDEIFLSLVLAALLVFLLTLTPCRYAKWDTVRDIMSQVPEMGLMALAMMAAVFAGGINLSVVAGASFSAIVAGKFMHAQWAQEQMLLASVLGVCVLAVVSALAGVLNGYLIDRIGIGPVMTTLVAAFLFEGLGLALTGGNVVSIRQPQFLKIASGAAGPIPVPFIIFIAVSVLCWFLFERSSWGRQLHTAACSSKDASRLAGAWSFRVLPLAYLVSGVLSGLSGMLISARVCSAKTGYGSSYLLMAVTAVAIGGADFGGKRVTVLRTVLGILILKVLCVGFAVVFPDSVLVDILVGGILIFVLGMRS